MNVSIIYFSQTGNTQKVAEAMVNAFEQEGHRVRAIPLREASAVDATGADLLGIGAPCYFGKPAAPVMNFLRALPPLDGSKAFVFATSAEAPARVLYNQASLLRRKGAEVLGGFLSRGEESWPVAVIEGRFPGRPNRDDLERARRFAVAVARHISNGDNGPLAEGRADTFKPAKGLYDLLGLVCFEGFTRLIAAKPRVDREKCNQCGWCVDDCPMQSITMRSYPVVGDNCIRCYHCIIGCPQRAFQAPTWLASLLSHAFYNTRFVRWFGDLEESESIY